MEVPVSTYVRGSRFGERSCAQGPALRWEPRQQLRRAWTQLPWRCSATSAYQRERPGTPLETRSACTGSGLNNLRRRRQTRGRAVSGTGSSATARKAVTAETADACVAAGALDGCLPRSRDKTGIMKRLVCTVQRAGGVRIGASRSFQRSSHRFRGIRPLIRNARSSSVGPQGELQGGRTPKARALCVFPCSRRCICLRASLRCSRRSASCTEYCKIYTIQAL